MSPPLPKTKASRSDRTRQKLVEAARKEFGEKGIDASTTRGIAERARCNEVTLFRHFESKHGLLIAVVKETSEEFLNLCSCSGEHSGDLRKDLTRFATIYDSSLQRYEGMTRALIGEGNRRPQLVKELIGDVLKPLHKSISSYLDKMKEEGLVRAKINTLAFAELLTASLMGGLLRRSDGLSELSKEQWISEAVEVFVSGIETDQPK
ncbi:MAG: TetR/AcrR family transcriptional regulator [Verrucomicrobiales bacterium]